MNQAVRYPSEGLPWLPGGKGGVGEQTDTQVRAGGEGVGHTGQTGQAEGSKRRVGRHEGNMPRTCGLSLRGDAGSAPQRGV